MKSFRSFLILFAAVIAWTLAFTPTAGAEEFALGAPFLKHAVLQRDKPVRVWGRSAPGDEITVEFSGQNKTAKAGNNGKWLVVLDPLPAKTTGSTLRASSARSGKTLTAEDILVGDVWLCSGQSNMLWPLRHTTGAKEEIAAADYPMIRAFTMKAATATEPLFECEGKWLVAEASDDPETASIRNFSGVAWHFAKEMHRVTGVPIGFIQPAFGGSIIEGWLPEEGVAGLSTEPLLRKRWQDWEAQLDDAVKTWKQDLEKWEAAAAEAKKTGAKISRKPRDPRGIHRERDRPSALFNAMVAPLAPFTIRGILWYQGESNAVRHNEYAEMFRSLIRSWRSTFQQEDLPFLFVQLPNFQPLERQDPTGRNWAWLREAQAQALGEPNTAMAVIIDLGEADEVHPRNKKDVGLRLALLAREITGEEGLNAQAPRFLSAESRDGKMFVSFQGNPSLTLRGEPAPGLFEVAGEDRTFHPASASLDGPDLVVSSPEVPYPIAVRYAWTNNPTPVLFGANGLPAAPFRSDDWPPPVSRTETPGPSDEQETD